MSAALGRLRRIFNPLLFTIHGAVEPTERTPSIHPKFAPLLKSCRRATAPRDSGRECVGAGSVFAAFTFDSAHCTLRFFYSRADDGGRVRTRGRESRHVSTRTKNFRASGLTDKRDRGALTSCDESTLTRKNHAPMNSPPGDAFLQHVPSRQHAFIETSAK